MLFSKNLNSKVAIKDQIKYNTSNSSIKWLCKNHQQYHIVALNKLLSSKMYGTGHQWTFFKVNITAQARAQNICVKPNSLDVQHPRGENRKRYVYYTKRLKVHCKGYYTLTFGVNKFRGFCNEHIGKREPPLGLLPLKAWKSTYCSSEAILNVDLDGRWLRSMQIGDLSTGMSAWYVVTIIVFHAICENGWITRKLFL